MTEFQKKRLEKLIKGEANFLCGVIGIKEECEIDTVHDLMAKFAEENSPMPKRCHVVQQVERRLPSP